LVCAWMELLRFRDFALTTNDAAAKDLY